SDKRLTNKGKRKAGAYRLGSFFFWPCFLRKRWNPARRFFGELGFSSSSSPLSSPNKIRNSPSSIARHPLRFYEVIECVALEACQLHRLLSTNFPTFPPRIYFLPVIRLTDAFTALVGSPLFRQRDSFRLPFQNVRSLKLINCGDHGHH